MKNKFQFTRRNPQTKKIEDVGFLEIKNQQDGSAELYFYGDIVSATWQSQWYEEDKCPQDISDFLNQIDINANITVYFNSGGGDVFAGIAIYNLLKRHKGHKTGIVDALAASIASVILMACDEIIVMTGAQVMVHKPWCMTWGNADDLAETIKHLDKCQESIVGIYLTKTKEGVTQQDIEAIVNAETWMTGADLQKYFDVAIENTASIAACASCYFDKYANLPEALKQTASPDDSGKPKPKSEAEMLLEDLDEYGI